MATPKHELSAVLQAIKQARMELFISKQAKLREQTVENLTLLMNLYNDMPLDDLINYIQNSLEMIDLQKRK